jgi:hypothetical protein
MFKLPYLLCFITLLSFNFIKAQNADFRNNLSFQFGANGFNVLAGAVKEKAQPGDVQYKYGKYKASPTFQLAWDYALRKWISVGIAGSYNRAKYSYENLQIKGKDLGNVSLIAGRTTFSGRILFHYANQNQLDFYGGFRLGIGLWTGRISVDIDDNLEQELLDEIDSNLSGLVPKFVRRRLLDNAGARAGFIAPQVQFIPFGFRWSITDKIGFGGELALGSPYFVSGGLNYRFE